MKHAVDRRAKNDVHHKLDHEIDQNESEYQNEDADLTLLREYDEMLPNENVTAEEEHTAIDDGSNGCRTGDRADGVLFAERLIYEACRQACENTLQENRQKRAERTVRHEERRFTGDEGNERRDDRQPCTCDRSKDHRAEDHNGKIHFHGHAHDRDLDKAEYDSQCSKQTDQNESFYEFMLFFAMFQNVRLLSDYVKIFYLSR